MVNEAKQGANDPFRALAYEWAWALFDRAVCAHMRGDDALALADCRRLNAIWPRLESEASRRGYARSEYAGSTGRILVRPYFDFLEPVPGLLADQERRAKEGPHRTLPRLGGQKSPEKSERIAALISDLAELAQGQWGQPGGVRLAGNETAKALIAAGDDAVEPLLDCLENDTRLTRSVSFHRDFALNRRVIPVQDAANAALDEIFKVHFETQAEYRAYWQKYKSVPLTERWSRALLDDQAGRRQWMQAAANILSLTDGTAVYPWKNAPIPNATNHYAYVAESLRAKTAPSVAELFIRRAFEIAPTKYNSSEDCWTYQDAADLGLMLAVWDREAATAGLREIIRRCPALYAERANWSTGCAVVPERFAALADDLAESGDTTGLDNYAKWVSDKNLKDLEDALPGALAPLGHFPNQPSIQEASAKLFQPENGDWLASSWPGRALIRTRLVLNNAFRALILLGDKSESGTIVLRATGEFEIRTRGSSERGTLKRDGFAPNAGESVSFRVCDDVARRLSRIEGLPRLELYWPEAKRDGALVSIVQFLRENGNELKLKPAPWPVTDE